MGEGVLERVLELGTEARLVQELGGLEMSEPPAQVLVRHVGDRLEQRQRHLLPDDRRGLEQRLSAGGSRSMRAARIAWTVAGTWTRPPDAPAGTRRARP